MTIMAIDWEQQEYLLAPVPTPVPVPVPETLKVPRNSWLFSKYLAMFILFALIGAWLFTL